MSPLLILLIVGSGLLFVFNKKFRFFVLHPRLWKFFRILFIMAMLLLFLAAVAGSAWYWWTVVRIVQPRAQWTDETLEQDMRPVTPNIRTTPTPTVTN